MIDSAQELSFGLVGCGQVVQDLHLPAWSVVPGVRLVAICDSNQSALDAVSRRHPAAHAFSRFEDFLDHSDGLSFVVLATPGLSHPELAPRILARRLNLLCEKPLALTAQAAHSMCSLAEQNDVHLSAIHNYRFKENTRQALRAMHRGELGDVAAVNLKFRSGPIFAEAGAWRRRERENRTLLFESGIHFVDIAMLFLGPLKSLQFLDADVDSLGLQRVVFSTLHESGARGAFDLMIDASATATDIEVLGEDGGLALQFFPQGYRRLPARDTPLHRCVSEGRRLSDYAREVIGEKIMRPKCSHRARSHAELFSAYVRSLRGEGPDPAPARELLPVIELLDEVASRSYAMHEANPNRDAIEIETAAAK
ncbi:MAG TPA: Gfo/Idh/MocA family oxidoreductase [Candidatus Binataceae bacterium]|nr:Gfo/Idh/MocA family oxidoreductase [Candidatus Binataceae bacterium]